MNRLLFIAMLALASLAANAQSRACQEARTFSVKPFAGLSIGTFNGTNSESVRNGFVAGIEGQYMLNNCVGISLGVDYSQQGAKYKDEDDEYELTGKVDYVNVPVLVNFYLFKGLAVKTGLQPGFCTRKVLDIDYPTTSTSIESNNVRAFDLAIPMGVSYEIYNIVADLRMNFGLVGIFKDHTKWGDENYMNDVIQLTLGYRF